MKMFSPTGLRRLPSASARLPTVPKIKAPKSIAAPVADRRKSALRSLNYAR